MSIKIMYKFLGEKKYHVYYVTKEQYHNFCDLAIIEDCKILKTNQTDYEECLKEIQKALDLAVKNDTSHILKLSEH